MAHIRTKFILVFLTANKSLKRPKEEVPRLWEPLPLVLPAVTDCGSLRVLAGALTVRTGIVRLGAVRTTLLVHCLGELRESRALELSGSSHCLVLSFQRKLLISTIRLLPGDRNPGIQISSINFQANLNRKG